MTPTRLALMTAVGPPDCPTSRWPRPETLPPPAALTRPAPPFGSCLVPIRIRGVAQPIANEIERHGSRDHHHSGDEEPRGRSNGLDVLGFLQQHPPTDGWRTHAESQVAQRGLADDQH